MPEGTLSSRLAAARRMLAERLARRGVVLSAGGLVTALAGSSASAQVPPALVTTTVGAAMLVAVGQSAVVTLPAAILMKGVLQAMLWKKVKLTMAALVVTAVLGAGTLVYQGGSAPARAQTPAAKPANELEALRKENELLKLNLQVVLEKVRAQEAELRTFKEQLKRGRCTGCPKPKPVKSAEKKLVDLVESEKRRASDEAWVVLQMAKLNLKASEKGWPSTAEPRKSRTTPEADPKPPEEPAAKLPTRSRNDEHWKPWRRR